MINQATINLLKEMRLGAMAATFDYQLKNQDRYTEYGFEERFGLIVDAEWSKRQSNKLERYIRNARFAEPHASTEDIEYHLDRKLDKGEMIRLASCEYIEEKRHIILESVSGNGKTFVSCALGNAACRKLKTVRYIRMPELLDDLNVAKACGTFKKSIKDFTKVDLLIIDEWLLRCISTQEVHDLLEIIESRRYRSTIFCSQYNSKGWYARLGTDDDNPVVEAILDRIIHNAYEIRIEGDISMRERHGIKARESGWQR